MKFDQDIQDKMYLIVLKAYQNFNQKSNFGKLITSFQLILRETPKGENIQLHDKIVRLGYKQHINNK